MSDSMILQAASFSRLAHGTQLRKYSGLPYYIHPARVAGRVSIIPGATAFVTVGAYLHDVIEDTPFTKEQLLELFPEEAVQYVVNLSDVYSKKAYPSLNRRARREREYDRLAELDTWSRCIKLADRVDNLRDMDPGVDFYYVYKDESIHLLDSLSGTNDLLEAELEYLVSKKNLKFTK